MSVLIIGGTGFIGARIARRLVTLGEDVVCLDMFPSMSRMRGLEGNVKLVQGDISRIEEIIETIKAYQVTRIIHTARSTGPLHRFFLVMALGTDCVFEAARLTDVRRVVFASSIAYHGPQAYFGDKVLTEDDPGLATWFYGVTKILNETMAREYNTRYGMNIVSVRPSVIYGPGKTVGQTWANDIIALPVLGKPVSVPRRSNEKVLLMHVDDVAEVFVQLCLRETLRHTVYHTGGSLCTVGELANMVKEFVPEAQISFNEQAPDISAPYLVDNSRMKQELGIHLRTLREGVIELLNATRCEAGLAPIAT